MTDLGLADSVDTTKPLLQSVGIPGQVIVDHQMRSLQVDAFAGSICGNQNTDAFILLEELLHFAAFVSEHATMDRYNCRCITDEGADFACQIVQCVFVFCKDD